MLKQILALTWKDLKVFFKDTGGMVFIFLQPFMFIVVMSYALGGLFGRVDQLGVKRLVGNIVGRGTNDVFVSTFHF